MTRIERLLWEEANLREFQRARRRSHLATLAKAVSIACVVAVMLLVAARPAPSMYHAGVQSLSSASAQPVAGNASDVESMAAVSASGQTPKRVYGPSEPTEAAF